MRLILIGLNVIILVLLGAYLLNFAGISSLGINEVGALFVISVAAMILVDQMVENLHMSNPWMYLVPGLIAAVAPILIVKQVSIISLLGVLLTVPGLVLFVKKTVR